MSETAEFGIPAWLPPAAARSVALAELRFQHEDRLAREQREAAAEQRRADLLAAYRAAAELRGEAVNPVELASGRVAGRPLSAIFAQAEAQAERMDAAELARQRRAGEAVQLHVLPAEPVIHAARSERGLKMARRYRHWKEARDAAAAAEVAAARSENDWGIIEGVTLHDR